MKTTHYFVSLLTGVLAALPALSSARNKGPEPVLTERGQVLEKTYSDQLDAINKEISAALPVIDAQKKDAFETARAELGALKAPREDAVFLEALRMRASGRPRLPGSPP